MLLQWNEEEYVKMKFIDNLYGCSVPGVSAFMKMPEYEKLSWG